MILAAILLIAISAWYIYSRNRGPVEEKTAAEKVAQDVATAENPFKADNPLTEVETNPFEKAKKVLNPFEQ